MKRAVITTAVFLWALAIGAPALAKEPPRIVDIRVGRHAAYDRLVLELERRVELRRLPGPAAGPLVLELEARPLLPFQTLHTPYRRMGTVVVKRTRGGAQIEVEFRPRRVRIFRLSDPARIVLDFADPGAEPFFVPPGTEAVLSLAPERPKPGPPQPTPPALAETAEPEQALPEQAESEAEPEEAVVAQRFGPDPGPPERPAPVPAPESPAPPQVQGTVETALEPERPRAWFQLPRGALLAGLLGLAMGLVLSVLIWRRLRTRPQPEGSTGSAPADWPRGAETITPEEIAGASDQVDLLARRIDEEVRARMNMEERLSQMQGELKVMRDRLQRAARKGG